MDKVFRLKSVVYESQCLGEDDTELDDQGKHLLTSKRHQKMLARLKVPTEQRYHKHNLFNRSLICLKKAADGNEKGVKKNISLHTIRTESFLSRSLPNRKPDTRSRSKTCPEENQRSNQGVEFSLSQKILDVPHRTKTPYFVTKSSEMIKIKENLLKVKHNLQLNKNGPILESIQDSVNEDKLGFERKMKLLLTRRGNYSLIEFLNKGSTESTDRTEGSSSRREQVESGLPEIKRRAQIVKSKQQINSLRKHLKQERKHILLKG